MILHGPGFELRGIKHIIFDKDGTITDAHIYWSEIIRRRSKAICSEFNLSFDSYYSKLQLCMGLGFDGFLLPQGPIAIQSRSEVIATVVNFLLLENVLVTERQLYELFAKVHQHFSSLSHNFIKPLEHSLSCISHLASVGITLSLATSDSLVNTNATLEMLGLYDIFYPGIVCCDSGAGDKSGGGPASFLCSLRGFSPSETISIGDAPMDFLMSRSAALKACILVSTGQIPFAELQTVSPFVCHCLSDLSTSS